MKKLPDSIISAKSSSEDSFFENLPKLMRPQQVSKTFGISTFTIYDWKYRGKIKNIPAGLFMKLNRTLYLRTDILKNWMTS